MSEIKDYAAIDVPDPDDKPYPEWHYTERRAYLLEKILKFGSPKQIHQTNEAERFEKAVSTIHADVQAVGDSMAEHVGSDVLAQTQGVFQQVVDDLLAEDDWRAKRAAFETVMDWNDWLVDRGIIEKAADKHEIRQIDDSETDDYRIVESDDDVIDAEFSDVSDDDDGGEDDVPDYQPKPIPDMDESP